MLASYTDSGKMYLYVAFLIGREPGDGESVITTSITLKKKNNMGDAFASAEVISSFRVIL